MKFSNEELYQLGCNQRKMIFLFLFALISGFLWMVTGILVGIIQLIFTVLMLVFLYQVGCSLKIRGPILIVLLLLMFVPLISLIVLVSVNARASGILQANGISVGLMGASKTELEKLKTPEEAAPEPNI